MTTTTSDDLALVERLRARADRHLSRQILAPHGDAPLHLEAASTIERLTQVKQRDSVAVAQSGGDANLGASAGSEPSGAWQPIETAPRDERVLLLWCPYVRNLYGVLGEFAVGCSEDRIFNAATHWMPLPAIPPETAIPEAPSDLDRAWRAVDALGGTHAKEMHEWGVGYDEALTLACAEIEKLGGRPS
jgi:hypothetical protein